MRFIKILDNPAADASVPSSPIDGLLGCHARIRHFMQLSRTLADAEDVPYKKIADAAESIFCHFSHALPLHEADENETLFPRLYDALPQGGLLREAAETMVEQHQAINELAVELLSLCASLSRQPERLLALARRLEDVTRALDKIFAAHLRLEETVVFPAIPGLLSPSQIADMSREMQQRRRPALGTIHLVQ